MRSKITATRIGLRKPIAAAIAAVMLGQAPLADVESLRVAIIAPQAASASRPASTALPPSISTASLKSPSS